MRIFPSSFGLCAVSGISRSRFSLAGLSAFGVRKAKFPGRPPGVLWAIQQNSYVELAAEIGLKAPSEIDEKTSDVGLPGGLESSVWSSERPAAVLLGFWAAFEATSWGSRWGAEPLAARLPLTTQLDFEPLRRFVGVPPSPRHVDEQQSMRRVEQI